jgi:hypothetical protein
MDRAPAYGAGGLGFDPLLGLRMLSESTEYTRGRAPDGRGRLRLRRTIDRALTLWSRASMQLVLEYLSNVLQLMNSKRNCFV